MNRTGTRRAIAGGVVALALGVAGCAGGAPSAPAPEATPPVAQAWAAAWNGDDPSRLGALFTEDATYLDNAVGKTSRGRDGVTAWKSGTDAGIDQVHVTVDHAFAAGDSVAVQGVYAGHIRSAPRPFAVPISTVLRTRGDLVVSDTDYYDLADLLRQSGLPPNWTPPKS